MNRQSPPAADTPPGAGPDDDGAATVLARIGGNLAMLRELLGIFETDSARLLAQLEDAVRARDGDRLARTAHTLKGMVGFFEAPAAVRAAVELDALGRGGRFDGAPAHVEVLGHETRRIATRFRALAAADPAPARRPAVSYP
jgi:HPt (histidine-containing phosphotransfer) domain-containing protein